jgi:hypothetical protein
MGSLNRAKSNARGKSGIYRKTQDQEIPKNPLETEY